MNSLDTLVRDLTKVHPMSKSEVRQRILAWAREATGEDGVPKSFNDDSYSFVDDEIKSHNRLRAEIRKRIGL